MKWKLGLGLGLACLACYAIPLLIGAGGLGLWGLSTRSGVGMELGAVALGIVLVSALALRRCASSLKSCASDGSCGCKPAGGSK